MYIYIYIHTHTYIHTHAHTHTHTEHWYYRVLATTCADARCDATTLAVIRMSRCPGTPRSAGVAIASSLWAVLGARRAALSKGSHVDFALPISVHV